MPKVSLGLPVFNGENFIRQAIESILAQTYRDFELVISDNCSTDGTREICDKYRLADRRIRLLVNPMNMGAGWNQNRVMQLAEGEYFKLCAHDDILHPRMLERCVEALDRNPAASLAFTTTTFIDAEGREIEVFRPDTTGYDSALPHVRFHARTSRVRMPLPFCRRRCDDVVPAIFGLIRMSALRQTPLFGAYPAADHILVAQLALLGPFVRVPEALFFNRRHARQSVEAHRNMQEQAQWWDPSKAGAVTFPDWRLVREYAASVARYRHLLTPWQQFQCYKAVAAYLFWNWPRLGRDLARALVAMLARFRVRFAEGRRISTVAD